MRSLNVRRCQACACLLVRVNARARPRVCMCRTVCGLYTDPFTPARENKTLGTKCPAFLPQYNQVWMTWLRGSEGNGVML